MQVKVLEIMPFWTTVEYEEDGLLQRRQLPTALCGMKKKGPMDLPSQFIEMGTSCGVDLVVALGETLPIIRVADLQDALRRRGLWTRQDYESKPQVVRSVLKWFLRLDIASIMKGVKNG